MKTIVTSLGGLLVVLLAQTSVWAENQDQDQTFLIKAMRCGVGEVRLSEYVAKHGGDEKVRGFADHLVSDHKTLNNLIAENARRLKVAVVAGQEKETRDRLDRLAKLKGSDMDVEYLKWMVDDHEDAIKLFQAEGKNGADPNLKSVARDNLPTLRKHLEEARDNLARLKK